MYEILYWLRQQKGGVGTYTGFQSRILGLRSIDTGNTALARLLGDLAGRFAEAYDGEPLPMTVANEALARLIGYVERAVLVTSASPEAQIAFLNEIGLAELVKARDRSGLSPIKEEIVSHPVV